MKTFDHPNIVKVFEWFEDDERIYLVMELLTGGDLH
jgi:calcium-dependent protein kinase